MVAFLVASDLELKILALSHLWRNVGFSLGCLYSWKIRLKIEAEPLVFHPDPLADSCDTGLAASLGDTELAGGLASPMEHQPPSEKVCGPFPDYTWPYLLLLLSWMDLASWLLLRENMRGNYFYKHK